ncbi:MAG TPA: formyltetrahydrofolate deformylase [Streptosporangiaceae bacterium]|nr:formyltetrahydrofolate deformylase [Streptosporangiaceae bacterium]
MGSHEFVLTLSCPDRPGIVFAVASYLIQHSGNILASQQYGEPPDGRFFMRVQFAVPEPGRAVDELARDFGPVAEAFGMRWQLHDVAVKPKTVILVSRLGHCLNDLLFRWSTGSLPADIVGVASNHADFAGLAAAHGVPFHHIPVSKDTRAEAETRLLTLVEDSRAELVVLARYMQIISAGMCKRLEGQMINIHHSFLPSFKGARPYHQAHARGVKLIGATAHYVTADLDEGPIIEQDVIRVDHTLPPARLAEAGRDVEAHVLARAVTWHAEHRVLLNGDRTVVFH